jgi:hypothetical protein
MKGGPSCRGRSRKGVESERENERGLSLRRGAPLGRLRAHESQLLYPILLHALLIKKKIKVSSYFRQCTRELL